MNWLGNVILIEPGNETADDSLKLNVYLLNIDGLAKLLDTPLPYSLIILPLYTNHT